MDTKTSNFNDSGWRESYSSRPYVPKGSQYENYQIAYEVGHESYDRYPNQSFDEVEFDLKREYESLCTHRGRVGLPWEEAKHAVRDAWDQAGTT